ncbi:MAG: alpha/beta hydrolase [Tistlia sp.]|uniref:alpha/beta fold hydrolase n=1 Tax=Tistlia sp. TaxID=3057121 RepID=UPI0034A3B4CF
MMQRNIRLDRKRSLAFSEAGAGPPVILIHGALATGADWPPSLCDWLVGRGRRVIALDRPGHGNSRRARFDGAARAQARQIQEALAPELEAPALVVGHSFGALVALAWAEQAPAAVAGLLLLAPMALPEVRPFEHAFLAPQATPVLGPMLSRAMGPLFGRGTLDALHRQMFAPQPVPESWRARYPYEQVGTAEHLVREGEDAAAVSPFSPEAYLELSRIRTPARIVAGEADLIVDPRRQALPLSRRLPAAGLTLVPGVGHMVHHYAQDAVRAALTELLAEVAA